MEKKLNFKSLVFNCAFSRLLSLLESVNLFMFFLNPLFVWLSDFATCKEKDVWKCVLAWGSQQTVIVMLIRLSLFSHYSGSFETFSSLISKPFPFTVDCTRKTVIFSFFLLWLLLIPFSSSCFFIYFLSFLLFLFYIFFAILKLFRIYLPSVIQKRKLYQRILKLS